MMTWKPLQHYWPFVKGNPHGNWWIPPSKGQWYGALLFSLLLSCASCWTYSLVASDLRCCEAHLTSMWWWWLEFYSKHYSDVLISMMASQITSLTIVYPTVYSGTDQRKHQSSVSLSFVQGIHWSLVNSPHKWPVGWKMFPFDDIIMKCHDILSDLVEILNLTKDYKRWNFECLQLCLLVV